MGPADHPEAEGFSAAGALSAPALHVVVVGQPFNERQEERARRHCLRRLLFELDRAGVRQVQMESRRSKQDARDNAVIGAFRAQRVISSAMRVDHVPGKTSDADRLLCIPDIVAGAVRADVAGQPGYLAAILHLVENVMM